MGATVIKSKIVSAFKRLLSNESGNAGIVVGMAAIPMVLIMGSAVDFERASNLHTELQSSVDSAALFAATLQELNSGVLTTKSKPYFEANFKADGATDQPIYSAVNNGDSVTVTASVTSKNAFMALAGVPTTTVGARSTVMKSGINLEVSLVLDNTGSMGWKNSKTGNASIKDLKAAATKFVDDVMPAVQGDYYTKIAAIPYNVGVNIGSAAGANTARGTVLNGTSTTPGSQNFKFVTSQDGSTSSCLNDYDLNYGTSGGKCNNVATITNCVTERVGTQAYTDAGPAISPLGRLYAISGAGNGCSVTPYLPLTTNKTALKATIANMSAANNTVGQVGIAWGWYTLSPNFGMFSGESVPTSYANLASATPPPTNPLKTKKIMILMTDGEYNSAYADGVMSGKLSYIGYNDWNVINKDPDNGDPFVQSKAMCAAIKNSGVELFVITFQLDKTKTKRVDLVDKCATDAKHIYDADTTSLDAAFSAIANQLQEMRIAE
jgi:Flp pilus assembly protein TadG